MVWEIVEREKDGIGAYEFVQGCVDDWKWYTDKPGGESNDGIASANMGIAARMAGSHTLFVCSEIVFS